MGSHVYKLMNAKESFNAKFYLIAIMSSLMPSNLHRFYGRWIYALKWKLRSDHDQDQDRLKNPNKTFSQAYNLFDTASYDNTPSGQCVYVCVANETDCLVVILKAKKNELTIKDRMLLCTFDSWRRFSGTEYTYAMFLFDY